MKPYELSRNSWHFRLAAKYGGFRDRDFYGTEYNHDFCAYLRTVLWAMLKIAVVLVLASLVVFSFYDLGVLVLEGIRTGVWPSLEGRAAAMAAAAIVIGTATGLVVAFIMGLAWAIGKAQDMAEARESGEPGFIALAIDKVRNKACVQIKFKD